MLPDFGRFDEAFFLRHLSQKNRLYSNYDRIQYASVIVFEFLLPLTRETELKRAMNGLFYSDSLGQRIDEIGIEVIRNWLPHQFRSPVDETLREFVIARAGEWFGGYSMNLVAGRFRSGPIRSRTEVAQYKGSGPDYLIDETTGSVRFVIPVSASREQVPTEETQAEFEWKSDLSALSIQEEIGLIRRFFFELFVETVVRTIDGEEEIWLREDAPDGQRL